MIFNFILKSKTAELPGQTGFSVFDQDDYDISISLCVDSGNLTNCAIIENTLFYCSLPENSKRSVYFVIQGQST